MLLMMKINQIKLTHNVKELIKITKNVNSMKILINNSAFNVINSHLID